MTLIEVALLIYFSLLTGLAIAMSSWIAHDKRRDRRIKAMVYNNDSWCQHNCKSLEECFSRYKDPDEAWREIEEICCDCPMAKAIDIWEQAQKRGGH
jgi:hypothetical protein